MRLQIFTEARSDHRLSRKRVFNGEIPDALVPAFVVDGSIFWNGAEHQIIKLVPRITTNPAKSTLAVVIRPDFNNEFSEV